MVLKVLLTRIFRHASPVPWKLMPDIRRVGNNRVVALAAAAIFSFLFILPAAPAAKDPRPRRTGLKIEVAGSGIYRITGQDIINAGIRIDGMDPAKLRMFHVEREIHIAVSASGAVLAADDTVGFYAPGIDNRFTGTDVFWLFWGGSAPGLRMVVDARPPRGIDPSVTVFDETLGMEENKLMWGGVPGAPETDYWFWERLTAPQSATYRFDAPAFVSTGADAAIDLFFYGRGSAAALHDVGVSLNGQAITDIQWMGETPHAALLTFPQSRLRNRDNELKVDYRGPAKGVIYVNRFELKFQRRMEAEEDRLDFAFSSDGPEDVLLSGFSRSDIRIYDITDPAAPVRVNGADIQAAGGKFRSLFQHPGGEKIWTAVAAGRIPTPDRIKARPWSNLKNIENGADYILITAADLAPAMERLMELRRRQGLRVMMADIEEIYDLFSFGRFDPTAIRDFLAYAWQRWQAPAPQFVLLAGDANLDYRNYYGTGKKNIVPGLLESAPGLGLVPSDNGYACVSGDAPLPDLYIGRIPGHTPAAMTDIVNKLILYESNKHQNSKKVLLVADDDERAFEELNDQLATYLAPAFSPERIYARLYPDVRDATKDIVTAVNSGMLLTSFVGHGDVTRWGVEPEYGNFILVPKDLSSLSNGRSLTAVLALNCLNGYFSQPYHYCLAEEWVKAPDRGAVACFAPAGLSHQWEHEFLSHLIFAKIFLNGQNRLGAVTIGAKIDAYSSGVSENVLTSFNLIGDPATRLAVHRKAADLVRIHTITATASAGGTIFPAGEVMVFSGDSQTFTMSPASGYRVKSLMVDGKTIDPAASYVFSEISSDHAIKVDFEVQSSSGGNDDDDDDDDGGGSSGGCFIGAISP
jgi:hypothetical protein